jgi:hypothetical protein
LRQRLRSRREFSGVGQLLSCAVLVSSSCQPLDIALFRSEVDAGIEPPNAPNSPFPVQVAPPEPIPEAGAPAAPDSGTVVSREPCLPGALACEACVRAADCAQGQVCHPRTGECVVSCANSVPACPGASVCDSSLGVCVACIGAAQCAGTAAPACDTDRGTCVECVTSSDCKGDPSRYPVCLSGPPRCGCDSNDDCPGGRCELAEGHCDD